MVAGFLAVDIPDCQDHTAVAAAAAQAACSVVEHAVRQPVT